MIRNWVTFMLASRLFFVSAAVVAFCCFVGLSPENAFANEIEIAKIDHPDPVDFERELLPILRKKCLACHNQTDAESDFVAESPQAMLKGGISGPAIVPGNPAESLVLTLAAHRDEPVMPPEDNEADASPLTGEELALLELWIQQGAKGEVGASGTPIEWQPLPSSVNPIFASASSHDGRFIAAGRANQIWVYDLAMNRYAGQLIDDEIAKQPGGRSKAAHLDLVQALAFSPDGRWIASGGYRNVKLWHRPAAAPEKVDMAAMPTRRSATVNDEQVEVSDKGETVVTVPLTSFAATRALVTDHHLVAVSDSALHVWQLSDGMPSGEPIELAASAVGAVASVDGDRIAVAAADGKVSVWSVKEKKSLKVVEHGASVGEIQAVGNRLVTVGAETPAKLWNLDDGKLVAELKVNPAHHWDHTRAVLNEQVAKRHVDNSNKDLEAAKKRVEEEDKNLKKTVESRDKAKKELDEAKSALDAAKAELQPLDEATAKAKEAEANAKKQRESAEGDDAIKQADEQLKSDQDALKKAEEAAKPIREKVQKAEKSHTEKRQTYESTVRSVETSEKALANAKQQVTDLEPRVKTTGERHKQAQEQVATAEKLKNESTFVATCSDVVTHADGTLWVGCDVQGSILICDLSSGRSVELIEFGLEKPENVSCMIRDDGHPIAFVKCQNALFRLPLSSAWGLAKTVGDVSGESPFSDRVTALSFSPDGKLLAVGGGQPSRDGELHLVKVADGEVLKRIEDAHSDTVFGLAFSPDGERLASCGADRFMKVFDWKSGKLVRTFEGHTHHVLSVSWRADGRALATGGADKLVKVWNSVDGSQLKTIQGFGKEVASLQFSGTSDEFFAACGDQNLYRCNVGGERKSIGKGGDFLYTVSTGAQGNTVAFAGHDSVLRVVDRDGKAIAELAPMASAK